MTDEQDPMLGDAATQDAYRAKITAMMQEEANRIHEERRLPNTTRETEPLLIGNQGFDRGISTA